MEKFDALQEQFEVLQKGLDELSAFVAAVEPPADRTPATLSAAVSQRELSPAELLALEEEQKAAATKMKNIGHFLQRSTARVVDAKHYFDIAQRDFKRE